MICESCNIEMGVRRATRANPYSYTLVGLPDVRLMGITVYHCLACGCELAPIPRIADLHRAIAAILERKNGMLSGAEIRYLRRQAGFSAKDFARLLRITPSTLSRVEADKQLLGATADQLVRLIVSVVAEDRDTAREVVLAVVDRREKKRRTQPRLFKLHGDTWKDISATAA